MGVLGFTKRYSRAALEECCRRALAAGRATYTFVKNSIVSVAECKWSFQGDSSATLTGQRMPCSWASPSAGPQAG